MFVHRRKINDINAARKRAAFMSDLWSSSRDLTQASRAVCPILQALVQPEADGTLRQVLKRARL